MVCGLGSGVWGLGFEVWCLWFVVCGLGFGVWCLWFGVGGLWLVVWGLGFGASGLGQSARGGSGARDRCASLFALTVQGGACLGDTSPLGATQGVDCVATRVATLLEPGPLVWTGAEKTGEEAASSLSTCLDMHSGAGFQDTWPRRITE
ncbi:hypothetical protein T484DRAFT_2299524 [Baffinella frigidus]|nr:hypothetical protein T484DRAFT_2299524 [Cryptophyta sp. CCMP2293]